MRLFTLFLLLLLFSCQPNKTKPKIISEPPICIDRAEFIFDKFVFTQDSNFINFIKPIDSINNLIERKNINAKKEAYPNQFRTWSYWFNNGILIKMEMETEWDDRPIYHSYYVLDNCYWIFTRDEFHREKKDSLIRKDLYLFKDTTILNSFVKQVHLKNGYSNCDSNRFIISNGKKATDRFINKLNNLEHLK